LIEIKVVRWQEATFCHGVLSHWYPDITLLRAWRGRRYAHCRLYRHRLFDRMYAFGGGESSAATAIENVSVRVDQ
jgi:hypothetical protein